MAGTVLMAQLSFIIAVVLLQGIITNAALKCKEPLDVVFVVDVTLKKTDPPTELTNLKDYLVAVSDYLFDSKSDLRIAHIVNGKTIPPSAGRRSLFTTTKRESGAMIGTMKFRTGTSDMKVGVKKAFSTLNGTEEAKRWGPSSILLVSAKTGEIKKGNYPQFQGMIIERPTIVAVGYTDSVNKDTLRGITKIDSNVLLTNNSGGLSSMANKTANKLLCVANKDILQIVSYEAKDDPARFNAEIIALIKVYDGPVVDFLEFDVLVEVLPKYRMANLTIADVDRKSPDLFNTLPAAKKLALTRQTLDSIPFSEVKSEIEDNFRSKGFGFFSSISISILMQPGHVDLGLALDMCSSSEQESDNIPAKMDALCKIISRNTKTFQEFMDIQARLCALCFTYILKNRPTWRKAIVADEDMKNAACDKIGQSFILSPSVLAQWALLCNKHSKHSACYESRPALMLHGPSLPSVADLAICKDVFCHRLCQLTQAEIDVIRRTFMQQTIGTGDVGCLAYLDGVNPPISLGPSLNASSIAGSCPLKSRVIKRSKDAGQRKKRACSVTCEDITSDIQDGIVPPDVLDAQQLETCLDNDLYKCVQKNNLGDYHWDKEQATAIFNRIRQDLTLKHFENSTGYDIEVLGYIGLGFTPDELSAMDEIPDEVYGIFGATYGWSKEQLQVLASRYLQDNYLDPEDLKDIDLARLNHLVCGLRGDQVKGIPVKAIKNTTPILGSMQRCEIEVLEVLAQRLILYYGPVNNWPEDHFSEFGIMLAGLDGDDLRAVGTTMVDHVTVPVVNHIPPTQFRKLTPAQTSLFTYDVSLAGSRRGLCAWLTDQHKQGYLEHLCNAGTYTSQGIAVLVLAVIASTFRVWSQ